MYGILIYYICMFSVDTSKRKTFLIALEKELAEKEIMDRLCSATPLRSSVKTAIQLVGYQIAPIREAARQT